MILVPSKVGSNLKMWLTHFCKNPDQDSQTGWSCLSLQLLLTMKSCQCFSSSVKVSCWGGGGLLPYPFPLPNDKFNTGESIRYYMHLRVVQGFIIIS